MLVTPTEQRFFRFLTTCAYHSISETLYLPYDVLPVDTVTHVHFIEYPEEDKSIWHTSSSPYADSNVCDTQPILKNQSGFRHLYEITQENSANLARSNRYKTAADRRAAFEHRLDAIKSYITTGAMSIKEGAHLIENMLHEYDPDISDEEVYFATRAELAKIPPYLQEQRAYIQPMNTSSIDVAHEQQLASYSHNEQTAYVPHASRVHPLDAVQAAADFQSALLQLQALTGCNTYHLSARYYPHLQEMIELCANGYSVEEAQRLLDDGISYQGRGGHAMQSALAKIEEEKARKN